MSTEQLFRKNMKLAYWVVHNSNIRIPGYDQEDLFQTALLGLWKACLTFDETKKLQFSTYATVCVKNELLMALRKATGKTKIADVVSLEGLPKDSGSSFWQYSDGFEDYVIESVDIENLGLEDKEKSLLFLRETMNDREISEKYNVTRWTLKKIRNKAKRLRANN